RSMMAAINDPISQHESRPGRDFGMAKAVNSWRTFTIAVSGSDVDRCHLDLIVYPPCVSILHSCRML
ncbi:hypothetical protein J6590_059174, partial [Homalodisca vitripennis]